MASHFARWPISHTKIPVQRLPQKLTDYASNLPEKRRARYLAARTLLAELMLRVYGIPRLPELTASSSGRPRFADRDLPDFSIAYAGNIVGVLLAEEEGLAGLGMEIIRAHSQQALEQFARGLSSAEKAWINAQTDPDEAAAQLWAMRRSVLKLTDEAKPGSETLRLHPASGRLRSPVFPDIQAISDVEPLMIWSCALSSPGSERLHLWEYDGKESWMLLQDIHLYAQNMGPRTLRLTSLPQGKTW